MRTTIDGIALAYDSAGTGEPLVLLHGLLLDRTIWDQQSAALADEARVIRPDLRGSGHSDCGEGPALMETLAGDLYGLLDAFDVERATIVGHALGGYVALAFFRMFSERVAGLGLIAADVTAAQPAELGAYARFAANAAAHAIAAAVNEVAALPNNVRALMLRAPQAGAAAQIVGLTQRVDSRDLLEDIAVPALIVAGENDLGLSAQSLQDTANAIADCEYVRLPGVGHLPMLEAPVETSAALSRLLERVRAGGGS